MWMKAEKFLSKDKYIGPLIEIYGHCQIKPRIHTDYFQGLVGEIVGQQLSGRVAEVIFNRLKKKLTGRITPNKILTLSNKDLRECGMSWAKVAYIHDLAQKVKNRKLHISKLSKMSDNDVMNELIAVKGIGRWTVEMFLMFSLGRPDVFPDDDLGIRKGFHLLMNSESGLRKTKKEIEQKEMAKFALRWRPYRTVASWYIWKILDK